MDGWTDPNLQGVHVIRSWELSPLELLVWTVSHISISTETLQSCCSEIEDCVCVCVCVWPGASAAPQRGDQECSTGGKERRGKTVNDGMMSLKA